jgi:FtsP/CotA-like multicopper oxidase with cupredoxin domain
MHKFSLIVFLQLSLIGFTTGQSFNNVLTFPDVLTGPHFDLNVIETTKEFFPSKPSSTFGYNSMNYMGPTLIFNVGEKVEFNITNSTPNETLTTHWHGFNLPAHFDGGPMNAIPPGETWQPHYIVKGQASTKWYHSHMHGITAPQVYKGLAGLIIVRDEEEAALNLPRTYAVDDLPLIIQDKSFDNNGVMQYDDLGQVMMINGVVNPFVECGKQITRLRLLNASVQRVYNIGFHDNRIFRQIATDGGLLEKSVSLKRVLISPGERVELLIDLQNETIGESLFLKSYSSELNGKVGGACIGRIGCGNGPLDGTDYNILRIQVKEKTENAVVSVPNKLATINYIPTDNPDRVRDKVIEVSPDNQEHFTINGAFFDMDVINDTVLLGAREIWRFENKSPIGHPMHIHNVQFNVIKRNNNTPPANMQGWKDVVMVLPNEKIEVIAQFDEFTDPEYTYMMHCHYLNHEDHGMMEQFIVIDPRTLNAYAEPSKKQFNVFPNPTSDKLRIVFERGFLPANKMHNHSNENQVLNFIIYDNSGKVVLSQGLNAIGHMSTIDISKLQSGSYKLKIVTSKGEAVQSFVKN